MDKKYWWRNREDCSLDFSTMDRVLIKGPKESDLLSTPRTETSLLTAVCKKLCPGFIQNHGQSPSRGRYPGFQHHGQKTLPKSPWLWSTLQNRRQLPSRYMLFSTTDSSHPPASLSVESQQLSPDFPILETEAVVKGQQGCYVPGS